MAGGGASEAPRRGRPRSERSRQAILLAASELVLERELSAISMDAVAERAGASKATIYRWWPSKELLVVDAVLSEWATASFQEPTDHYTIDGIVYDTTWFDGPTTQPNGRTLYRVHVRRKGRAEPGWQIHH